MHLKELLTDQASMNPSKIALICDDLRLTYKDINDYSDKIANQIKKRKIKPLDRIAIYLENYIEAVISLFAVAKVGGVFVIINPEMKNKRLAHVLRDSGASIIVCSKEKIANINASSNYERSNYLKDYLIINIKEKNVDTNLVKIKKRKSEERNENINETNNIPKDLSALIYTSGSTGLQKGVMAGNKNILAAVNSIANYLELDVNDKILSVLPLSFDYGLYQVFLSFLVGCSLVLEKTFAYPNSTLKIIEEERVTVFPIVPTMVPIIKRIKNIERYNLNSVRCVTSTGAHLNDDSIIYLDKIFSNGKIFCMYGLTECKRVSYLPPDRLYEKIGSVGIPMQNVKVHIVNQDGKKLGYGNIGELVISGPNVMLGYWNSIEKSNKKFKKDKDTGEIYLYSGDIFKIDEEGYLYYVERKDDIIKVKGETVSPKEIENVINEIDGIVESAVVGIPDELYGNLLKAYVVIEKNINLTVNDILKICSKELEGYMRPKSIEILQELPKNDRFKIDKSILKKRNSMKRINLK